MHKFTKISLAALTSLGTFGMPNVAHADSQQMRELVPDATRARKSERTHVFARAQFIYSPGNADYLHHWVDRPLFVNPALDADKTRVALMSPKSYRQMQETVLQYGMDGFAFFPQTTRRAPFYELTKQNDVPDFTLLSEFFNQDQQTSKSDALKMALANPASFRINGKLVITSYNADTRPIEFWKEELAKLHAEFGDSFVFLPDIILFDGKSSGEWKTKFHNNSITTEDVRKIKEYLRGWARATDGLYNAYVNGYSAPDRNFDADFYRDFVIRLMKSVLAEPEFKDKYFGLSAAMAHENATRFGFTLSSDATKTLRHSFEAAMDAQPDLINIPEWDEQNENTSLRPTVYNGLTSMRIMRSYTAKLRAEPNAPLANDNASIPDLIVSYRKTLVLGEKLEVELLNVPDSSVAGSAPFVARLSLLDAAGKTVYSAPSQKFSGAAMEDHTITIPSETLPNAATLRPRVEIAAGGKTQVFEDGFQSLNLRSTWNWDYKWAKQSLRDILVPQKSTFEVGVPNADGFRVVSASFAANEPLQYVEITDDNDTVYSYSKGEDWRENADQIVLRLSWLSFGGPATGVPMNGTIALRNAQARWLLNKDDFAPYAPILKDQSLNFANKGASMWRQRALIAIPRALAQNASLKIDLPDIYQGEIPVRDILQKTIYGIPGPRGFNLVISRDATQDMMPAHIDEKSVSFQTLVKPESPNSILLMQAIGESGRIYRSRPVDVAAVPGDAATSQQTITVYSSSAHKPVQINLSAGRVPDIRYQFDPSHGSVLVADAGRPFWGILGGYFEQATGRGGGNAGDSTPYIDNKNLPKDLVKTAPTWIVTEAGENALQFDGVTDYITLPQGVIPRRAAFTIEMDIKPNGATGKQILIANRSYYSGSLAVYTEGGILKADFLQENLNEIIGADSGLALPVSKWSHLTIRYDQKNLIFDVDGKTSPPLPMEGPGLFDTATVVGSYGKDAFKGQIKSLRIRQGIG